MKKQKLEKQRNLDDYKKKHNFDTTPTPARTERRERRESIEAEVKHENPQKKKTK